MFIVIVVNVYVVTGISGASLTLTTRTLDELQVQVLPHYLIFSDQELPLGKITFTGKKKAQLPCSLSAFEFFEISQKLTV